MLKTEEEFGRHINKLPGLFRPPFGVTNPNIAWACKDLNYTVIGWSIRTLDTTISKEKAVEKIREKLTGGDITLRNVRFHTKDRGRVQLTGVEKRGTLETREDGGRIVVDLN